MPLGVQDGQVLTAEEVNLLQTSSDVSAAVGSETTRAETAESDIRTLLAQYQTLAGMSSYQTVAAMASYLTTAAAASTYQTLSGMSAYATYASLGNTYAALAGATFTGAVAATTLSAGAITSTGTLTAAGNASVGGALQVGSSIAQQAPGANFTGNAYLNLSGVGGNFLSFGQLPTYEQWVQSGFSSATSPTYYDYILNPLGGNIRIGGGAKLPGNGHLSVGGVVVNKTYTVATLPTGMPAGARAFVTDAMAPSWNQVLTGGGTTSCSAVFNGSAWVGG